MRLSSTSMGLAENIKRMMYKFSGSDKPWPEDLELHLLQYKQKVLEYLLHFEWKRASPLHVQSLTAFSGPHDMDGYADNSITDDVITELFLEFSERSRQKECEKYLRTLTGRSHSEDGSRDWLSHIGKSLSLDNTFRSASKATIVDPKHKRVRMMRGGLLSVINEMNEILSWVGVLQCFPALMLTKFISAYVKVAPQKR